MAGLRWYGLRWTWSWARCWRWCSVDFKRAARISPGNMATMRVLTACGLLLAFCALALLAVAMSTDYWYETDARRHRERCKKYAGKRTDPGYIYISSQNLPLRMLPQRPERGGAVLRERRDLLPPSSAMESRCSRRFNSTATGLWRKCHREGFDQENEELIFKGETGWDGHYRPSLVHDSMTVHQSE